MVQMDKSGVFFAYRTKFQKITQNVLLGKETTYISVTTILTNATSSYTTIFPEVTFHSTGGGQSTQRNPSIIIIGKLLTNGITEC